MKNSIYSEYTETDEENPYVHQPFTKFNGFVISESYCTGTANIFGDGRIYGFLHVFFVLIGVCFCYQLICVYPHYQA